MAAPGSGELGLIFQFGSREIRTTPVRVSVYSLCSSTNRGACFRTQLGSAYLYLAMESQVPEFRRRVIASVGHLAAVAPETANKLVRSGLTAYLTRRRTSISKSQTTSTENEKPAIRTQPLLLAFLSASTAFGRDDDKTALREKLLSETIVLAHHPEICKCDQLADPKRSEVMVILLGGNS